MVSSEVLNTKSSDATPSIWALIVAWMKRVVPPHPHHKSIKMICLLLINFYGSQSRTMYGDSLLWRCQQHTAILVCQYVLIESGRWLVIERSIKNHSSNVRVFRVVWPIIDVCEPMDRTRSTKCYAFSILLFAAATRTRCANWTLCGWYIILKKELESHRLDDRPQKIHHSLSSP